MKKMNLFLTIAGCLCLTTSCGKEEVEEVPVKEFIVKFWNGDHLLYADFVKDGQYAKYEGPDVTKPSKEDNYFITTYDFIGWGAEFNSYIKADTDFKACFNEKTSYKEEIEKIDGEKDLRDYLISNGHKEQGYFDNEYLNEYRLFIDNGYYIAWEEKYSRLHCCYSSTTDVYGFYFYYGNLNYCRGFISLNGNYKNINGANVLGHYVKTFYGKDTLTSGEIEKLVKLAEACKDYVLTLGYGFIY